MTATGTCGTPAGIRAHQAARQTLCVVCRAGADAWSEYLDFITPRPQAVAAPPASIDADDLEQIVERRRVLATFGNGGQGQAPRHLHHLTVVDSQAS